MPSRSQVTFSRVGYLLLAASVGLNILLPIQLHSLQARKPRLALAVGDKAPVLTVSTETGRRETVDFSRTTTSVLYFFSTDSDRKGRDIACLKELRAALGSDGQVRGIIPSSVGLAPLKQKYEIAFEVSVMEDAARISYMIDALPQTMIIDSTGVVKGNWRNGLADLNGRDMAAVLGIGTLRCQDSQLP